MSSTVASIPSSIHTNFEDRKSKVEEQLSKISISPKSVEPEDVQTTLNYLDPSVTNPFSYTYPVTDRPAKNHVSKTYNTTIHDWKAAKENSEDKSQFSLDVMGFELIHDPSFYPKPDSDKGDGTPEYTSTWFSRELFDDDKRVEAEYYPKVKGLLFDFFRQKYAGTDDERFTLPKRIEIFDHTIRRNLSDWDDSAGKRKPVSSAHVDQTNLAGWRRFKAAFREDDKKAGKIDPDDDTVLQIDHDSTLEDYLADLKERGYSRVAIINVWRPLIENLEDFPLGFADYRSINPYREHQKEDGTYEGDLIKNDFIYPKFSGETYNIRHSDKHKWYYLPHQSPHQVGLIKCFDSLGEVDFDRVKKGELKLSDKRVSQLTPHSAFENTRASPDAPPRESIEIRTLVFF